ncbi:hypothetical protein F4859DRAFT_465967 [Xylaria cf. heliscus]|nr:hypothetical protein F4859DRAFT_465967 [Xylaria cf. heliscus]
MSYYIHPDVKTLKVIADNWWHEPKLNSRKSSRTNTPHDARALARLVSTSSWAVQDPYSEGVAKFIKWYRKAQATDLQGMSDSALEDELWKFMADVDDLFFFSLLTRKVEGQSGRNGLVEVRVVEGLPNGSYCGAYRQEATAAVIRMWRDDNKGKPRRFEHLIYTLVHEMCHAYLDLFSDRRHRKYQEWVSDYQGHGEMFWVLLRFVAGKIGVYTQSDRWHKELEGMESECYELTKTSGDPGSWGTPERILMGSVLGS